MLTEEIRYCFDRNGNSADLGIPEEEIDDFWDWIGQNIIQFEIHELEFVHLRDKLTFIENRCFGNSCVASLLYSYEYYEGAMCVNGDFVHHGFNVFENKVIDSTAINYGNSFVQDIGLVKRDIILQYYGIRIPNEFFENRREEYMKYRTINYSYLNQLFNNR